MSIIKSPNKQYNGITAGLKFTQGQSETSDPWLKIWFEEHGYTVEEEKKGVVKNVQPDSKPADKPKAAAGNKRRKSGSASKSTSDSNRNKSAK